MNTFRRERDYTLTAPAWSYSDPIPDWQWIRESPVMIIEENELPQWGSPEQILSVVKDSGAEFVRYPAVGWGAHFYGKSSSLPKYPTLDRDLFGEVTACMHDNGVKVMAYMHFGGVLYREILDMHPDWFARDEQGNVYDWNNVHYKACICSDSLVSAMLNAIDEVISVYHADCIYLDGPIWYTHNCQCENCRRKFREYTGVDLPLRLSDKDGTQGMYNDFRDHVHADIVQRAHSVAAKYGVPLLINTQMKASQSRPIGHHETAMMLCEGGNTTEVHRPLRFWQILQSIKLGESFKKVSLGYCPPGPYESYRTYSLLETTVFGMTYAIHGGTPMLEPGVGLMFDPRGKEALRELCEEIRRGRDMYYRAQPVKETALVYSAAAYERKCNTTLTQYEQRCFDGAFEALCGLHRHFDCISDAQISYERLKEYKTVFFPMGGRMDEEQSAALRAYVENGGTLIAGHTFSLLDGKYELEDLLGAEYIRGNDKSVIHQREYRESAFLHGYAAIPEAYVDFGDLRSITTDAVVGMGYRTVDYSHIRPHANTETLATLYLPADGVFGTPLTFPEGTPPAVLCHPYGKGKVILCASNPWERCAVRRLPEQRQLIGKILDAANPTPVIDSDAPACVYMYLTEDADARYLHLLNYCGNMYETAAPIDFIAPLYDLKLTYNGPISRVEGAEWDGENTLSVPKLGVSHTIKIFK